MAPMRDPESSTLSTFVRGLLRLRVEALLGLLLALAAAGCASLDEPASASFASVVIPGRSPEEIAAATEKVFADDGFSGTALGLGGLVFEKEASRARTMSRAGLVGTHDGQRTLIRVRAEIVPLPEGSHRLQCRAYDVTGSGDAFFDDEVALSPLRSGPYRSLLGKVAKALK